MSTQSNRSTWGGFGSNFRRRIAAVAAYSLALTTVVVGAIPVAPVAPADAAIGDGVCYLIADSGGGNGGNDLLTIVDRGDFNPVTNETSIGTGTGTYNIEAMDMHPATLELYATDSDQLGTIDKLTGLFTPIGARFGNARGSLGSINIDDVDGLAFNYNTNVLYGAERQGGNDLLVQIDYVTGSIVLDAFGPGIDYVSTNVSTLGHDDIDDLAFHPFTNELYGSITGGGGPGRLVKLDPATGIATDVGPFGTGDIEGMRFDAEGFLWGTSGTTPGELFEINITTGAATNPRTVDNGGDYESTVCYVPGSDLWVEKSVDNQFPGEETTVTYTVEVVNAGPANATGVVVEDSLPSGVTFVSATGQGTYDPITGLWAAGSILRGESASIDITVSVDTGTAGSTITNTATRIAVDQGDAVPNNDTASVDIFPNAYADLAVSKTVSNASPAEGDTVTFTITLVNNGPNATTGVTINDALPSGVTFVSSNPSQGSYGSGVWTVGSLAAGATETLEITATVDAGTALTTITNTAAVGNTDVTDPDSGNDSSSASLTVSLAGLEIVKTSDAGGLVEPGQTITYTLDISNVGTAWLDGLSVEDLVPAGTTYVPGSATIAGLTGSSYLDRFNSRSYNNSDGTANWTTSWSETGESTSATGGDIQIRNDVSNYQLRVRDDANSIQRSADLSGAAAAVVSFDFRRFSLDNSSEVVYFEVASSPSGPWRQVADFRGPANDSSYSNTGLLALLPGELTPTSTFRFRTPSGGMSNGDGVWIDNFRIGFAVPTSAAGNDPGLLVDPGDGYILPAGTTMQATFQVLADDVLTQGTIDNDATADATGAIPATDSVSDRVARADLAVDKTVDNGTPNPGDTINYTITVTNNGPTAATKIELTDVLPAGVTYVSDSATQGSYAAISGLWALGSLPPGGSATLTLTATVDSGTEGTTITNTATITQTDRPDPDPTNDEDSADIVVPVVDLAVDKTVDIATPNEGDTVTFTVTATNNGPDGATGVTLSDLLPAGLTYVSDSATQGSYAAISGLWALGSLAAGVTETLTLTATVDAGTYGTTIVNTASIDTVDQTDSDPTNDSDSARVGVQHNPAIQVVKDGPLSAEIGETVTYTFTVSHTVASDGSPVTIGSVVDDVAGSASYVSGDTNTNSLLDGGEVWIYTATHAVTASDPDPIFNTVTVTATDEDGDDLPDATDDHTTDVEHLPVLAVTKSGPAYALVGDTVTFTFVVSHDAASDNTPVGSLAVTDDYAGSATYVSGDDGDGLLEAGETWTFTADYTILAGDPDPLVNTGTASGTDEDGDPVEDSDSHSTDLIVPAISIEKTPDNQQIVTGNAATFTITVTNTGDIALSDAAVTDPLAPDCDATFVTLAAGATESYSCTVANVTADFTNTASVTGDHPAGGSVGDADTADVDVIDPSVAISKTPDTQQVAMGDGATFTITVTNTGDVALANVTVTDPLAPDCDATFVTLAAGATESYACTVANVTADFTNVADVTAQPPVGPAVTDSDTADVDAITPAVNIDKTPDLQYILSGDDATFTITVTNTGDVPLSDVAVTDVLAPDCDATFATLGIGASETYSCTATSITSDFTNTADVSAQPPAGAPVSGTDTADVDVIAPAISIDKTPDLQTILAGDEATFTITVTNTGDADLTDVTVTDALAPDCDATFASLAVGASESYSCNVSNVTADFTNTASIIGDHPAGGQVTDSDDAAVDVIAPSISIEKTPDLQTILSGDDATFTITVVNTGDANLTNVTVSDALAPACGTTFVTLAAGATESYSCTVANVTADFTNVADVTADHPAGGQVTDSDDAVVDVIVPAITIQKSPDLQTILAGDDATFTITVINTGDADLTNVTVSDALAPACGADLGDLAAGDSTSYLCSMTNVAADTTNVADVVADHDAGGQVTDSDDAFVDVIAPSISIDKTPDLQYILSGDDADFTITVVNTGDADLTNVTVSDPLAPACDTTFASLAVGATETYSCTVANVTADFTNVADVVADHPAGGQVTDSDDAVVDVIAPAISIDKTPDLQTVLSGDDADFTITVVNTGDADLTNVTVSDPLAPACDTTFASLAVGATETYSCTFANVTADFTNVADVVADHAAGGQVTDSDDAAVDVIAPSIEIQKSPELQTILSGDDATFTITVSNTGDADLTDVTVTDALAPACDTTFVSLGVGATESYSCTFANVTADFTNVADVTADHPAGGQVTDSDDADVDVIAPAVEIQKTPDTQQILAGDTADFTITVTNTGDAALTAVTVTDALAPDCDATFASLAIGASQTFNCSLASVTADFTNVAGVTADHPAGGQVTDSDDADVDVVGPAVTVEKTPDNQQILGGGDATFTITVTNTGDVDLTDVTVTDAQAPACDATFASLAIGASESYSCTVSNVTADFTNVADVTADHPVGGQVTDSDDADVDVVAPSVEIQKTPDNQQILGGGDATFTITVTNTGDVDLTDVTVTDALAPACDATFASLAVGASESYSCTVSGVTADFTNVADVVADHPAGGQVTDSDDADVDVVAPSVEIQKAPDNRQILTGGTADFTITVTNTGDVDLTDVTVTDALAPACDATFASLAVGASESYSCTVSNVTADFTNVADVVADHPAGGQVTGSDDADVDVVAPSVEIQKAPDTQQILGGGDATFTITVANTGDVDLSNVTVSDPLAPDCDATFAALIVGATETYACSLSGIPADFTNVADVVADHPAGGQVTDSDDADVDVVAPSVEIQKTPDNQQILTGGTADFTITVTNTGDVDLSNVTVTDPLAPNCDASLGSLTVGASTSYACSLSGIPADFTNVADVVADHPAGGQVTDSDDAAVDIITPAIDIQKSPDTQQVVSGGTADFTITVTNIGDAPLTDVTVVDALAPACDATFLTLAVGASESFTCSLSAVAADFTNVATVSGDHAAGGSVFDSDAADVDVIVPAIDIEKTPDLQTVLTGADATFTITVTNTGDVDLSNVAVTDALAPACDATFASLAIGATESYSCTVPGVAADFTNVADVTAEPPVGAPVTDSDTADVDVIDPSIDIQKTPDTQQVVSGGDAAFTITVTNTGDVDLSNVVVADALAPACDATFASLAVGATESYPCALGSVTADFTNVADVTADHPAGGQVTDIDDADVDVVDPAIDIEKTPDSQTVVTGGDATFTITVTNTGDTPLSDVTVTDVAAPACDATFVSLPVGASESYSCTLAGVTANFTNVADVTGDSPVGGPVTDSDTADVDVIAPAIEIQKTPETQQLTVGDDATFTITVTNTGDTLLTNVTVTDVAAPACDATFASLAVGASESYSCTLAGVTADFTNVADVTGDSPVGGPVTDSDDADVDVVAPAIDIEKTPDSQTVVTGGDATFTITVTNTGDTPLSDVTVTDVAAPACDATFVSLAVGASESYSCTVAGVTADFTNVADVTAQPPVGGPVTDSDDADVDVIAPAIDIEKTPDSQTIVVGGTANFTITVTNTGDTDLDNVAVIDALSPNCDATIGSFAAGDTTTYSCSVSGVAADFTNVAVVAGEHPVAGLITDSDVADVTVIGPAIDIEKTPDLQTVASGDDATFTISVTNTGDVDLSNVTVTDAQAPACDATFASLTVGASEFYSCSLSNVTADFTNVADVLAEHSLGGTVGDSDTADVVVVNPAIEIQKTPDTQTVASGDDATFTITVTNTGDADLSNVTVTDAIAPACDATVGALAVGESTSYDCTVTNLTADFTNVASVSAEPPVGSPVTDSDTADVDVITPAIDIQKTPDLQSLAAGADATFTITVTNIGDADLTDVAVTDALAPVCDATVGALAVGESTSYDCTVTNVTADFTNVADVTAEPPVGGPVTDSDTADVDVIAPEIDIQKTPDTQTLVAGSDATFTITVTNIGDADLTNVTVTDALAPFCDANVGALAVGESTSYDCTVTNVTAGFTNTADVASDAPGGITVSDSDTADVVVIGPAIQIDKTPDTQTVLSGADITFTITVTNIGDADLTNVTVTDALAPVCDANVGALAVGESTSYDCTVTNVTAGFTNTATVSGDHAAGGSVGDSDTADVVVIGPAIQIDKTPDNQQVVSGDDATFTITVTNTGDVDLSNVAVTDAQAPACDATFVTLAAGATESYTCTVAGVAADFTNVADVVADHPADGQVTDSDDAAVDVVAPVIDIQKTPDDQQILPGTDATFTITVTNTGDVDLSNVEVTDTLAPDCDAIIGDLVVGDSSSYSCTLAGVAADMVNTAAVTGEPPVGSPVSDSDTAAVDVISPAINVEKTPDLQHVLDGDSATFTITVTNTGDVDLSNVAVTDTLVPSCDAAIGDLAAGASTSYDCTVASVTAGFTNSADVVGDHPAGGSVSDSDDADVVVINPAINLEKDPALQQILSGEDATFTITVTNIGDSPLTNVTITDPQAPACDTVIPALGVGGSTTVSCSVTGVTADFTNTASVVATHAAGGTVTDSDTADVQVLSPLVDIQKTPDLQIVASGGTASFDITVTNAGVVPLSNVVVTDALVPDCDATIGDLAVGESTTYSCSVGALTADFTNTAVVDATDAAGNPATDSDIAVVDVVAPEITVTKSPDGQAIVTGGTATFTIDVTNTGDIDLTNVAVTDALAPTCDNTIGNLAIGASASYTCDLAGITADFTNTATASGDHAAGGSVSDSDTADVTVLVPGIGIQKTPDTQLVGPGGDATFTIEVTNTGATPLTDVTVTDTLAPNCDATVGDLDVGESSSYTCTLGGIAADFTNTADVTGDGPLGNPVTDSDIADVDFVDPAIAIDKTPDLQTLLAGEDATFSITVTNTGDTDLTNIVVSDPLAPGCDATFASLVVGESQTFGCSVVAVAADFTNVASVSADTPLGTQVTDSDDALVDVVTPGVEIQKTPDIQQVHVGDDAVFTITVTNTGDQDLVDLTVTDALAPACDTTIPALAVGESASHSCTLAGVTADLTNIAAVDGTDALGNPVSDSDDAAVDVIDPAIDIQKTPDVQTIVAGGDAVFTITVTNTGDVALTGVTVSDPLAPACDNVVGDLAAGESTSYSCTSSGVTADFTNTASVTGIDPIGSNVTDADTADVTVLVPGVDIQKTPDLQLVTSGGDATFTITVANAGATNLTNVTVTDALAPNCDATIGDLAVGESSSYTCTLSGVSADFTNTADAAGDDPLGNPVADSDTADVEVISPAITISKSPDGQSVALGSSATFTIEVTNTGDSDLTGVVVTDPQAPACDNVIGDLATGASVTYTCSLADVTADFTNTASVTGNDPLGTPVGGSDTADVTVLLPGIDIQKTPDLQTVLQGDDATFTIIVTNTGATDLFDVAVSDPLAPACDRVIGDLPVGSGAVTYTCTVPVNASFTNTASVTAEDPAGGPVTDEDTADVVAVETGTIEGTIAHDVAGDGAIGAGDAGLGGVDVSATWAGLDGVFGTADDEVFTTSTDGSGDYEFLGVPPGDYQIVVDTDDLPPGLDFQTLDPDSTLDAQTLITLPPATTVGDIDFAFTATGFIGDTVFFDIDGDGIQGPTEPGVPGVWVAVHWHGPDGVLGTADDLVYNTTTVANGNYLISGLPGGQFTVVLQSFTIPEGLSGDLDQSLTLDPGAGRDDIDFPLIGNGVIGDQVFEDLDLDGEFDSGEPGVPGVTVNATWAGFDGVLGTSDDLVFTTVTDANGQYLFDTLPAGEFLVAIDDSTVPGDLGSAPPVTVTLAPAGTDLTADFPLIGNRPPIAVDDSDITDQDTPVTITVLDDDSDPDGHDFAIDSTTDPANGSIVVNADGTITYTPDPGFWGVDTFTYTICELPGVSPSGIPATGLCDTATVTVTINPANPPNPGPGPEASFQTVVVGDSVDPMPITGSGPVTVTFLSGDLPPGITWNPDGTFSGNTTEIGVYVSVYQVCDDDDPQICIEHTHTIAVTPVTLPGPGDPPDPDNPPDTLPFTGANFGELFLTALALLITGAGLVVVSRRRETE